MTKIGGVSADHLRSYIERIERLEEEKKARADDIKEVFAEAKWTGFDVKAMRAIIKIRKMDKADVQEQSYMINIYIEALGMFQPDLFGVGDLEDPEKSKSILFDGLKRYKTNKFSFSAGTVDVTHDWQVILLGHYTEWAREAIKENIHIGAVISVIGLGDACRVVDSVYQRRNGWAKSNFLMALDLYSRLQQWQFSGM